MTEDVQSQSKTAISLHGGGPLTRPRNVYRILSGVGLVVLTVGALAVVAVADLQRLLGVRGLFGTGTSAGSLSAETPAVLALAAAVTVAATLPLCKPRPRRILDTVTRTLRSLLVAAVALATVGYFTATLRLPRPALLSFVGVLAVTLPGWFVALQQWQLKRAEGTLIVGNNPKRVEAAVQAAAEPIVGYAFSPTDSHDDGATRTDGGRPAVPEKLSQYECLGGLSRLDDILDRADVGTVIPALPQTDRAEFFGVLETCHRHDVNVEILNEHNESVLVEDESAVSADRTKRLIAINMEPLDLQNRVVKRLFDVGFAGIGLLVTLPLFVPIAVAIKLDSRGPVFYRQERTTQFGDRFPVYKFRSMRPESEAAAPGEDEDRITRVGRFLRRTHLDELPQLWAIFTGKMSVVGPRAAWTAEEEFIQQEMETWKKRWFVKPGLTGLAQINEATSENSRAKLQYDLTYIKNQSFWFDTKIVLRQVWMVLTDLAHIVARSFAGRSRDGSD
ncbi:exopolysaccharide biosynthesis polyprenyl glycosylphosphotransferase [Halostella salina]|uniref:exopolysaccharide biosynthesis polyprenyl glycosylphosphotransferase n=1 Tax=Halostella salina TaxID=1547897 RepID=UPI000EF7ACAE|nr:exopolysaccharide biosynthesis polyprenyl glycosylphosphotransferase [Halostella salina]